jgi:hypothetical protein
MPKLQTVPEVIYNFLSFFNLIADRIHHREVICQNLFDEWPIYTLYIETSLFFLTAKRRPVCKNKEVPAFVIQRYRDKERGVD